MSTNTSNKNTSQQGINVMILQIQQYMANDPDSIATKYWKQACQNLKKQKENMQSSLHEESLFSNIEDILDAPFQRTHPSIVTDLIQYRLHPKAFASLQNPYPKLTSWQVIYTYPKTHNICNFKKKKGHVKML